MNIIKEDLTKRNELIYHIYWGTSGNSGLYLDEIYEALKNKGYNQRAFVNYYYPFNYGDKIFFKRGDIANSKYKGLVRKIFQLQEILFGLVKILHYAKCHKPKLINFSHAGSSFFFIYWFLKAIKRISRAKLVVTCHDIMPLSIGGENGKEIKFRTKIFNTADNLIVHNLNSIIELKEKFNINPEKVLFHPFPLMDLNKIPPQTKTRYDRVDFLFIGHLRKAKGIEFLLDAWMDFHKLYPEARLRVCGKQPNDVKFNQEILSANGVDFHLHFISDDDYYHFVKSAKYVILPYLLGTNSGIISTVLSLGTDVITSDLPMFAENPLVISRDMFVTGDKLSLISKLEEKFLKKENDSENKLVAYREEFNNQLLKIYKELCN